jgi:acyl-CoA synthetase (AMP-forming)/AMP-acid ligase II
LWSSDYEAVEVGDTTLHRMVAETAGKMGESPALIDGPSGNEVSYGTLASRMERVAAGLAARGFEDGDVLAVWAPNLPQCAGVALGAMAAGGTITGINPAFTRRELGVQLADSGASVLVTVPNLVPAALAAASAGGVREIVVLGEAEGATLIEELIGDDGPVPEVVPQQESVALLPYSSGTTGLPKGVMLTHSNVVASVRQVRSGLRMTGQDTTLAVAPFFHIMGFVVSLAVPLASGSTVVTMPRFEPERFFALIQQYRATVLAVPPPVMAVLAHHPMADEYDLSSLQMIVSGGAPLGVGLQCAVAARFPHVAVGQAWGMTETTVVITLPDRDFGSTAGSVGRVMPNTALRVVDPDTGRDLGVGEQGNCG